MRAGRIEQIGGPEEIYARPQTDFVADFVGISNLLVCRVISAAGGLVEWEGERLRVPLGPGADGTVIVSIRPEKLAVGIDAAADRNRLQGVLEVVTFLGPFVRLEVTVHGRPFWVDVPTERATALERRKPLTLAFAPTDCVVLPEGTPAVP